MQGETAAGDNVRQTAVLLQELVKVQVVVAHNKLNVYVRQLRLHIGGVLFVQGVGPQIDLNGFGILLRLHCLGAFSGASAQQGYAQHHSGKQGKNLVQSFLFHPILLLATRSQAAFPGRLLRLCNNNITTYKKYYCNFCGVPVLCAAVCKRARAMLDRII